MKLPLLLMGAGGGLILSIKFRQGQGNTQLWRVTKILWGCIENLIFFSKFVKGDDAIRECKYCLIVKWFRKKHNNVFILQKKNQNRKLVENWPFFLQ